MIKGIKQRVLLGFVSFQILVIALPLLSAAAEAPGLDRQESITESRASRIGFKTGKEEATDEVNSVAYSPDEKHIALRVK